MSGFLFYFFLRILVRNEVMKTLLPLLNTEPGGRWIEKRYAVSELPDVISQHLKEIRAAEAESSRFAGGGTGVENGAGDLGGNTGIGGNLSGISSSLSSG